MMTVDLNDLAAIPPGRFRVIQLATGEKLDLNDPTLGRADGLELWDHAKDQPSSREAPVARCLFPECGGAPVTLKRVLKTGTRYASHYPGEGAAGVDHSVVRRHPLHDRMLDVWTRGFDHVGWAVTARERGLGGGEIYPDILIADAPQPTGIEAQLSPTKTHIARTRKAAERGITAVWNSGPGVDLRDRVPELRFTTDIADVLARRNPWDLPLLGVRELVPTRVPGRRHPTMRPFPKQMRMGDIVEQLPAGALVPIAYGKTQILVSSHQAGDRAVQKAAVTVNDLATPARPPVGEARRHVALAAQAQTLDVPAVDDLTVSLFAASSTTRATVALDWSDSSHIAARSEPCQECGKPTRMRSERGRPWHKVCAEKFLEQHPSALV